MTIDYGFKWKVRYLAGSSPILWVCAWRSEDRDRPDPKTFEMEFDFRDLLLFAVGEGKTCDDRFLDYDERASRRSLAEWLRHMARVIEIDLEELTQERAERERQLAHLNGRRER